MKHHRSTLRINFAREAEVKAKLQSGALNPARDGAWFCNGCDHWTEADCDHGPQNVCFICRSPLIKWRDPIQNCEASGQAIREARALPAPARRERTRIALPVAHARFEALRASLD